MFERLYGIVESHRADEIKQHLIDVPSSASARKYTSHNIQAELRSFLHGDWWVDAVCTNMDLASYTVHFPAIREVASHIWATAATHQYVAASLSVATGAARRQLNRC